MLKNQIRFVFPCSPSKTFGKISERPVPHGTGPRSVSTTTISSKVMLTRWIVNTELQFSVKAAFMLIVKLIWCQVEGLGGLIRAK